MITRVALVKLAPAHATLAGRQAIVDAALGMLPTIPGVLAVTAGAPADEPSAKSWDVLIVTRFAALETMASYPDHPTHRRFVDEIVSPRSEVRKVWSFATTTRESA